MTITVQKDKLVDWNIKEDELTVTMCIPGLKFNYTVDRYSLFDNENVYFSITQEKTKEDYMKFSLKENYHFVIRTKIRNPEKIKEQLLIQCKV